MTDLVVVPTALRQRRASRRLCDAQGGLLLGPRVCTLRALVPGLLARAGETRSLLPPLAEGLVALSCAEEAGLVLGAPPASGAARAAVDLVAELRRAEVPAARLRTSAEAAPSRAAERLRAAGAALDLYERRLEDLGALDAAGALRAAADAARRGGASEETGDLGLLVLEGFLSPSPGALDLVAALAARARRVLARVPYLPADPRRSAPAEPWVRRIESLHELAARGDVGLEFPAAGPSLAVARALGVEAGERAGLGRVAVLPAPGDEDQALAAARFAADLLEAGLDPEEVAVVAPRRLAAPLARAFEALAVPLAGYDEPALASAAPVRDLRTALAAADGLDRSSAELLLGSAYLRFGGERPEGLSGLLDRAGALDGRGDPEERLRRRAGTLTAAALPARREREELVRAAEALRGVKGALASLRTAAPPREWAQRLAAFLEHAGARRRAACGEGELARRDLAALRHLEEGVDDLCRALALAGRGDQALSRSEWLDLFDLAVGAASFPGERRAAAAAVELWPPEEAPGLSARAVLVLGAERGTWPVAPRADPLLGEAARAALNEALGRRALATAAARQAEAEYLGLWALTAGSEVLGVGFTRGPEGEGPAPLAAEVLARAEAEDLALAKDPPLGRARSEAEVLRAAARLWPSRADEVSRALAPTSEGAVPPFPELLRRVESAGARGLLEAVRRRAFADGGGEEGKGPIPPELREAWERALPKEWSATQLETHARCPYRLFLRTIGVPDAEAAGLDVSARDEGRLLHAALEAWLRERGAAGPAGPAKDRGELRRVASEVFRAFAAEGSVGDAGAWPARREALLLRLERWVEAEAREESGLAPALLEYEFGGSSGRPPLEIPDEGGAVLFRGRIDRVDADGGRLLVVDYKNSRGEREHRERLAPEALGRTSFQPALYVLAAARELGECSDYAATYGLLRSAERVPPWRSGRADPFLALDLAERRRVAEGGGRTFADDAVAAVRRIRSGVLPIASRDCTGCPFGSVCRFPRPGGEA